MTTEIYRDAKVALGEGFTIVWENAHLIDVLNACAIQADELDEKDCAAELRRVAASTLDPRRADDIKHK